MGLLDPKAVVAANLQRLLDRARERREPYDNMKALAKKAGVGASTVKRILMAESAAAIDTLDALARVYRLRAWQLLIPNLDPSNPPVVP